jgi:hypothetical protein
VGNVTLIQAFSGVRSISLQELFWNRSITRVVLLPGAARFDNFRTEQARIGQAGTLTVSGRPVSGPLLVDTFGSVIRLRGARELASGPTASLWLPDRTGRPRLAFYALGRYYDGWLAAAGVMYVWPEAARRPVSGWISMRLTSARSIGAVRLTFGLSKTRRAPIRLLPGQTRLVRLAVCAPGSAHVTYRSNVSGVVGLRVVSVRATEPVFTPSRSACTQRSPAPANAATPAF